MKLIVGLGNPGTAYQGTRHNIGSRAVRQFALRHDVTLRRGIFSSSLSGKLSEGRLEAVIAVPLSYMNLSGQPVRALIKKFRIEPAEGLLVVFDDIDLEPGVIRFRTGGSAGGHNGVKSVIAALGSQEFNRLRIGVGRPARGEDPADYVLSRFVREEHAQVEDALDRACAAMEHWLSDGSEKTMNLFNR